MNRNNVIKPGWGLLCLCMLLAPLFVRSQETPERECILIVSSYNPDTRRMARFITEFEQQILALGIPCDICIETLECKGIADAALWMSLIDNMITRYESRSLRAVVLLGQEAWASFVSLGRIPEGVMCFCGFVSSNGVMLPPAARFVADVEAPFGRVSGHDRQSENGGRHAQPIQYPPKC